MDVPFIFHFNTLAAKLIGAICSVAGGLAIGKEGPFVHAGAAIAAILSQVRATDHHGMSGEVNRSPAMLLLVVTGQSLLARQQLEAQDEDALTVRACHGASCASAVLCPMSHCACTR